MWGGLGALDSAFPRPMEPISAVDSFNRQLNYFGFVITRREAGVTWKHSLFQRDEPQKMVQMERKPNSGNNKRKASGYAGEPRKDAIR